MRRPDFEALLTEYQKAPRVTRDRLYIEAIEEVYGNSNKVLIDSEGSGNLLYLPLDQLMKQTGRSAGDGSESNRASDSQSQPGCRDDVADDRDARERRIRQ